MAEPQTPQTPSQTPNRGPTVAPNPTGPSDCLACRLTGAATFTGLGGYALYTAAQQGAFKRVRPRGSPVVAGQVSAALGVVFLGLGIGRLFI